MIDFKIIIPDIAGFVARLKKMTAVQNAAMERAIDYFLLSVLRDSKDKPPRVPVDTGFLQSTGYTEPAKIEGKHILASIGYSANYAVYVHDNLNGRIKHYKRPGSGAKFLSTHLDARRPELTINLEKAMGEGAKELFH